MVVQRLRLSSAFTVSRPHVLLNGCLYLVRNEA